MQMYSHKSQVFLRTYSPQKFSDISHCILLVIYECNSTIEKTSDYKSNAEMGIAQMAARNGF